MNTLELKIPPPLVAIILAAAMWAASHITPMALADGLPITVLAVVVALTGGGISIAGVTSFRRAKTTVNPLKPQNASSLVTGGIYHITRNPMYVGLLLVLTGWALFLFNPWPLLGPIAFVAYITRFQIKPEERILLSLFGEQYAAYMAEVRRWL